MNGPQRVLPKLPDVLPNFLTADSEGSWDYFDLSFGPGRQKRPSDPPNKAAWKKQGTSGVFYLYMCF